MLEINPRRLDFPALVAACKKRIAELDLANRSISNTPEKTLEIRVEIRLLMDIIQSDKPDREKQQRPHYDALE